MITAKKLGFKKGDFVYTGLFPAILIYDVHTATPCCEVWGLEHECGSAYASDLKKIDYKTFASLVALNGYKLDSLNPYSDVSKQMLKNAGEFYKGGELK